MDEEEAIIKQIQAEQGEDQIYTKSQPRDFKITKNQALRPSTLRTLLE